MLNSILGVGQQPAVEARMAQLAEGKLLDLANPFTGQLETHADLIQLYRAGAIKPHVSQQVQLKDIPSALERLEARAVEGRAVLVTS